MRDTVGRSWSDLGSRQSQVDLAPLHRSLSDGKAAARSVEGESARYLMDP